MTFDTVTVILDRRDPARGRDHGPRHSRAAQGAEGRAADRRERQPLCREPGAALYGAAARPRRRGAGAASPTRSPRPRPTSPAKCSASTSIAAPAGPAEDLRQLKGVGPKFVARLNELGITRFDQLAGLNANEVAHLDERMGPFQGRLAKDRVIEQADLLARRDIETFEERFGKLGG